MSETQQLLAEYAKTGSESAFRELVARYVDLVYSAAVRLVNNDSHLAQDVTQTVFADFARAARTLSPEVMIGGWLHRHTCFVASKTIRGEQRRRKREQQAALMNATDDDSNLASVAPVLDDAINQLGPEDRRAILLRFF
jgi:RNA polymerase sigma factor (sigma-70 family)